MSKSAEHGMGRTLRAWGAWIGKFLLSGLLLWMTYRKVPVSTLAHTLREADPRWIAVSLAVFLSGTVIFEPMRFESVNRIFGGPPASMFGWVRLFIESRAFLYALPSGLGQEGFLWWTLKRMGWSHRKCVAWLGFLRMTGLGIWLVALAGALRGAVFQRGSSALLVGPLAAPLLWALLGSGLLLTCAGLTLFLFDEIVPGADRATWAWGWASLSTLGTALTCVLALQTAARGFGVALPLDQAFGVQTLLFIAMVLPVSVAGFGVQEGLLLLLAPGLGFAAPAALGMSLALHLQRMLLGTLGLLLLLVAPSFKAGMDRKVTGLTS